MHPTATPTDSPEIVVEYTYTLGEAIRASAAVGRRVWVWIAAAYAVVGAVCILNVVTLHFPAGRIHFNWTLLVVGILLLSMPLLRPVLHRYLVRRQHARLAMAGKPVRWTITRDTLEVKTAVGESRMAWSAIIKARETDDGFVLYTHPRIGQWLPKSGFEHGAACDQLRVLLAQRGIPFKRR